MSIEMTTVGWQGITIDVPQDWSLVGVSGDEKKGLFRVDGPFASGMEVRWQTAYAATPDLEARIKSFLRDLEKSAKKSKSDFSSKLKKDKTNENSVLFFWKADRVGQGRIVYCEKCRRVVIAQVIYTREDDASKFAGDILSSIKDHRDDGWVDWGLYGLNFAVPPEYKIEKQEMLSGYLALFFRHGAKRIVVQRWGLVDSLIGDYTLDQWYKKDVLPDIKGYRVECEQKEVLGHPGVEMAGKAGGIKQLFRSLMYKFTLYEFPSRVTGFAWHSPEVNRILGVWATHEEGSNVAEGVRDTVRSD